MDLLMFDFDGTLVDSAQDIGSALNKMLKQRGKPEVSLPEVKAMIGDGFKSLVDDMFPEVDDAAKLDRELYNEFCRAYDDHVYDTTDFYPGVTEFLDHWRGDLAIVSNKPERYIHGLMDHLNFDRWDWKMIVGGDTFEKAKPHALPITNVLQKMKVEKDRALMIGDGVQDMGAANNAGVKCIVVDYGYSPIERLMEMGAHARISNFIQLKDHLNSLT